MSASQPQHPEEEQPEVVDVTGETARFYYYLQTLKADTPRFLFHAWSNSNPDQKERHSNTAVTPTSCSSSQTSKNARLPSKEMALKAVKAHLNFQDKRWKSSGFVVGDVFSTWSPSWRDMSMVLEQLINSEDQESLDDMHIGVMDTKNVPASVPICPVRALHQMDNQIPETSPHYLVYNVVKNNAYSCVSMSAISVSNVLKGVSASDLVWPSWPYPELAVQNALELGKCFADDFILPVTAAVLTAQEDNDHTRMQRFVEALKGHDVPSKWQKEFVKREQKDVFPVSDDMVAFSDLMRSLIKVKHDSSGSGESPSTDAFGIDPDNAARLLITSGGVETDDTGDEEYNVELSSSSSSHNSSNMTTSTDDLEAQERKLPNGQMDDQTKRAIIDAQMKYPPFLFCAWCNHPGCPSGGFVALNNRKATTPLAIHKGLVHPVKTIFDLSKAQLKSMVTNHLQTSRNVETEFSSWASYLNQALTFSRGKHARHPENQYMAVIDARYLGGQHTIIHVPDLLQACDARPSFDHEHLAHGILQGPSMKSIPLRVLESLGIEPIPFHAKITKDIQCKPNLYPGISAEEIAKALEVGDLFGDDFVMPVSVAILTRIKRCGCLWDDHKPSKSVVEKLANALAKYEIPAAWCADPAIVADVVYTNYGEVRQMVYLLNELVDYHHGKGAKGRLRQAEKDGLSVATAEPLALDE